MILPTYGLASRALPYGLKKSVSAELFELSAISNLGIHCFDGALSYPWLKDDLEYLKTTASSFFTKASFDEFTNGSLIAHLRDIDYSDSHCLGVLYHSPLTTELDKSRFLQCIDIASSMRLPISASVYTNSDLSFLASLSIPIQSLQVPINISTNIDFSLISSINPQFLIARSTFLQSAYFNPSLLPSSLQPTLLEQISIIKMFAKARDLELSQALFMFSLYTSFINSFTHFIFSSTSLSRLALYLRLFDNLDYDSCKEFVTELSFPYSAKLADPRSWFLQ